MRRFKWPLQRVLDIRIQQAGAQRLQLARLSQQAASVRREIFSRQAAMRNALDALGELTGVDRIVSQQEFMRLSGSEKTQLDRLESKLAEIEAQRREKAGEYQKTQSACETLEKLWEKAAQADAKAAFKLEQKEMDDNFRIGFARELIAPKTGAED